MYLGHLYYIKKDTAASLKYLDEVLAIEKAKLCWGYKMAALDKPLRQG